MGGKDLWPIDTTNLPVMKLMQPVNTQLCGIYGRSFAYYSLIERLPRIINLIIDYCSEEGAKIKSVCSASDEDLRNYIRCLSKLKSDLVTNQVYELFSLDTPEARRWNAWIESQNNPRYFTNIWLYSECYVYRKIREAGELSNGLASFDPFEEQKRKAFDSTVEMMCAVAERMGSILELSDKQQQREAFVTLIKVLNKQCFQLCLWSNQCDLSLTVGAELGVDAALDPFQMIHIFQDKLLVDHAEKVADYVLSKAESSATAGGDGDKGLMFDIVCDNAGYELFADLCLAHFLVAQKIVEKVRFHVKDIPWFVSDVTPKDFNFVIQACQDASFSKTVGQRTLSSESLRSLGRRWRQLADDGAFIVMHSLFWTSPHVFKDMPRHEPALYRSLQHATVALFKGDLNCRKLLGETSWPADTTFDHALQGFHPTALVSARTVKSDLVCGLRRGHKQRLDGRDRDWMQTGQYGMIVMSEKVEPLAA